MNKVIVFGNDHTNSVGVIQSLGLAGFKSVALLFGRKTGYVVSSKFTDRIIVAKDAQSCIDKLLSDSICSSRKIPIIACCDTAALLLEKNANRLEKYFVFEHAKQYSLQYLVEKEHQVQLAKDSGFNVPKSWNIKEGYNIPEDVIFPCIIKPIISCEGEKSDIRVCKNLEELHSNINSLNVTKRILLQQYIDRDYEISILGCGLSNGDCIIPAVEHKLTLYPKYVGLECLANMQPLTDIEIENCVRQLIKKIGYVGLFSIEMMHSKYDNKYYFTEINLRNDGAEAFVTKYGANLPLNHIEDLLNLNITKPTITHPGYYIWEMHHFQSMLARDISLYRWIKEIFMSKGFLMTCKGDMQPFYKQFEPYLRRALSLIHICKNKNNEDYK